MADLQLDAPLMDELGEEAAEPPKPPVATTRSDFGEVQLEGRPFLEIIKVMESRLNEMLIKLRQSRETASRQPNVYVLLKMDENDERSVAIDMFNLWRNEQGEKSELESDCRTLQKELKTLDRLLRREGKA